MAAGLRKQFIHFLQQLIQSKGFKRYPAVGDQKNNWNLLNSRLREKKFFCLSGIFLYGKISFYRFYVGRWCNGSTPGSGPGNLGSNPSLPVFTSADLLI